VEAVATELWDKDYIASGRARGLGYLHHPSSLVEGSKLYVAIVEALENGEQWHDSFRSLQA